MPYGMAANVSTDENLDNKPAVVLKACSKCGRPCKGRYCPAHQTQENARRTRKVTEHGYRRANSQGVRRQRLEAAGYVCELRLPGCTQRATHVHLAPTLAGNHDDATVHDCQACCASCSGAIDAPRAHHGGAGATRDPPNPPLPRRSSFSLPERSKPAETTGMAGVCGRRGFELTATIPS
jgi:hypothetical protein